MLPSPRVPSGNRHILIFCCNLFAHIFLTFLKLEILVRSAIEPKNYTNLKQFIEACQQKMNVGLEEAKKIYVNSTKKRNIRL